MRELVKTVLKHIATGIDGMTYDVSKVCGIFAIFAHTGLTGVHLYLHGTYDGIAFSTGAAAIIAAIGASVGMKLKGEPQAS